MQSVSSVLQITYSAQPEVEASATDAAEAFLQTFVDGIWDRTSGSAPGKLFSSVAEEELLSPETQGLAAVVLAPLPIQSCALGLSQSVLPHAAAETVEGPSSSQDTTLQPMERPPLADIAVRSPVSPTAETELATRSASIFPGTPQPESDGMPDANSQQVGVDLALPSIPSGLATAPTTLEDKTDAPEAVHHHIESGSPATIIVKGMIQGERGQFVATAGNAWSVETSADARARSVPLDDTALVRSAAVDPTERSIPPTFDPAGTDIPAAPPGDRLPTSQSAPLGTSSTSIIVPDSDRNAVSDNSGIAPPPPLEPVLALQDLPVESRSLGMAGGLVVLRSTVASDFGKSLLIPPIGPRITENSAESMYCDVQDSLLPPVPGRKKPEPNMAEHVTTPKPINPQLLATSMLEGPALLALEDAGFQLFSPIHATTPPSAQITGVSIASQLPVFVAQVVQVASGKPGQVTEIALSPDELGRVRLSFRPHETDPDRIVVMMNFERPEAMDLFRRHADQLVSDLRAAGFSGADLGFAHSDTQDQPNGRSGVQYVTEPLPDPILARAADTPLRLATGSSLDLRL
jgi:hypothetical protein